MEAYCGSATCARQVYERGRPTSKCLLKNSCACRCFAACPRCTGDVGRGAHCKRNGKFFNCRRRLISSQFTEVGRADGFSGNISNLFPEVGNPPLQPQRKILQLPLPPAPGTRKGRFLHGDPAPTPSNLDTFKSANPSNSSNTTRQPQPVQDHAESPTSSTNTTPEHTLAPPVPASPPVRPPRGVCSQPKPICMFSNS